MITPAKGDYANIPINAAARKIADAWDPAKDQAAGEACKAYAAPAIMREPGRLRIAWQDDNTLKIETDAGMQTRLLRFAAPEQCAACQPASPRGRERRSRAGKRRRAGLAGNTIPLGLGARAGTDSRTLEVITTRIRPGYLRKNGVPFSAEATRHRVLRSLQRSRRPGLVRRHDHRPRSAVPQRPVGDDEPLQEGTGRREVEAHAVRGAVSPRSTHRALQSAC